MVVVVVVAGVSGVVAVVAAVVDVDVERQKQAPEHMAVARSAIRNPTIVPMTTPTIKAARVAEPP